MPRYIVKAIHPDDGRVLYGEWSTVVDAPVSEFGIMYLTNPCPRAHSRA